MGSVTIAAKTLSAAEAVTFVFHNIARTGKAPSIAVRDLWPSLELSDEALQLLAQEGLAGRVSNLFHNERENASAQIASAVIVMANPNQECESISVFIHRVSYEGAGGEMKIFAAFTIEDCRHQAESAEGKARGFAELAATMRYAAQLLKKHGALKVGDLPSQSVQRVAKRLGRVIYGEV